MKIAIFGTKEYEREYLTQYNTSNHDILFISQDLTTETVNLAKDCVGCCCFLTDDLSDKIIAKLAQMGVKFITLRSAGYDHVDLSAAYKHNMTVMRVPKYSPEAIAELAVALILALSRNIIQAHINGLNHNFTLDSLLGFNIHGKTVGVVGTGNIGSSFAKIMNGFGARILAYDPVENDYCKQFGVEYSSLDNLLTMADIVSLHCPLNEHTHHMIDSRAILKMKTSVMLINTGRGGLIDTAALINGLRSGKVAYAGLDVYENEKKLFFKNCSQLIIDDENFLALHNMANVLITPHMAFLTKESVQSIAKITMENIESYLQGNSVNTISLRSSNF